MSVWLARQTGCYLQIEAWLIIDILIVLDWNKKSQYAIYIYIQFANNADDGL